MPPTPFPNRYFNPPADNLDWGGWDENNNQKESEMTAKEFLLENNAKYPSLPKSWDSLAEIMQEFADHCIEHRLDENGEDIQCDCGRMADREFFDTYGRCEFCEDVSLEVELYAKEKHKEARHAAAKIALTVGSERDVNAAHRDIINIKF